MARDCDEIRTLQLTQTLQGAVIKKLYFFDALRRQRKGIACPIPLIQGHQQPVGSFFRSQHELPWRARHAVRTSGSLPELYIYLLKSFAPTVCRLVLRSLARRMNANRAYE